MNSTKNIALRAKNIIDNKIKPIGSLGLLEEVALQLAIIQNNANNITIKKPHILIFAADHGIAANKVSIAGSEVTTLMVENFLNNGAAINCFCNENNIELQIIDAGILTKMTTTSKLVNCRLGSITADFSQKGAMSLEQLQQGLNYGRERILDVVKTGSNTIGFGEMGIGNTSSAAALMAAVLKLPAKNCVGVGTGIDNQQLERKIALIEKALILHEDDLNSPLDILRNLGGFEIVEIVGAMLECAQQKVAIIVDGFIVSVAALIATKIDKTCHQYMIFSHKSAESGHEILLAKLQAKPLLDLNLRLGEGSAAALAIPLLKASCAFYNNMKSFKDAGIEL